MSHTSPMEETAPQTQPNKGMNKGLIVVALIVIFALAIVGYEATKKKDTTTTETAVAPSAAAPTNEEEKAAAGASTTQSQGTYKDGTYTVTGDYTSPGGPEEIEVTLTLEGDTITEAEVVSKAERPISKEKQAAFIGGYKDLVVGKSIDEVKLDKVSGSSLTPKGFNDAVEKVKEEAQA